MRHPLQVYIGKIREYDGSRPSAIAKIQVDGELKLTELGLEGDEQAEKVIHGGLDRALCHYPREHYSTGRVNSLNRLSSSTLPRLAKTFLPRG